MWHVHFSVPQGFARMGRGMNANIACSAAMPGMGGADASAPSTPFGPSLVGAWVVERPGLYAVFVMAKVGTGPGGSGRGLLAPAFYLQVGPEPSIAVPAPPRPPPLHNPHNVVHATQFTGDDPLS